MEQNKRSLVRGLANNTIKSLEAFERHVTSNYIHITFNYFRRLYKKFRSTGVQKYGHKPKHLIA